MAKTKKKTKKQKLQNQLSKVQVKGNSLFKQREALIANLNITREALQQNLQQQHELEEKINNGK